MNFIRQLALGLVTALASSALVLGALSLASAEGILNYTPTPTITSTPRPTQPGEMTDTPQPTPTSIPPTDCPPPPGWISYILQPGDTLDSLSILYNISVDQIMQANCLRSTDVKTGSNVYLPPLPTATPTATSPVVPGATEEPTNTPPLPTIRPCGPPAGWVPYIIQPGDTLLSLSRIFGVSVAELQFANCIDNPHDIKAGAILYVPFIPVRTPTATNTNPPPPSSTPKPPTAVPPTSTPVTPTTAVPPTATFTPTFTPVTPTNTPVPTDTPIPTDTETPVPTETPTP